MTLKRVLIFGSFDLLHEGHRDLFRQAREYGEELHVIVARDKTIEEIKKKKPHYGENVRFQLLEREPLINVVHMGDLDDKYRLIKEIMPFVIVLGYDQTAFVDELKQKIADYGLHCKIVRAKPYFPLKFKSSIIRKGLQ